jgi:hypothetical protein
MTTTLIKHRTPAPHLSQRRSRGFGGTVSIVKPVTRMKKERMTGARMAVFSTGGAK